HGGWLVVPPPCFPRRGRADRPYRTHPLPPPTAAPAIPTSEGRGPRRREQPFPEVSVGPLRRGGPQRPYGFLRAVVLAPRLRRQDTNGLAALAANRDERS